jgi:hypothetical protein
MSGGGNREQALRKHRIQNFVRDAEPHSSLRDISIMESESVVIKAAEHRVAEKLRNFDKAFN